MTSPIDLVIPMVFPQDPEWQREYLAHKGGTADGVMRHTRYRSWDTEHLLVRCACRYMPWLRHIIILLAGDSQVQPWMTDEMMSLSSADGPRLRIVFHHEFMPDYALPCFSSPCIEMFLSGIPGLSEQFIYANDDMFPLGPLHPDDFFRDGRPCLSFKHNGRPVHPSLFERKCLYQQDMVDRPFGGRYKSVWLESMHSFAPILRSCCDEVWRRHGDEIVKYLSPLRRNDRSYNHYIYLLYQYFAGLSVDVSPVKMRYVGRSTSVQAMTDILREPDGGIVCLNDNEHLDDWKERAAVVRSEISKKLRIEI